MGDGGAVGRVGGSEVVGGLGLEEHWRPPLSSSHCQEVNRLSRCAELQQTQNSRFKRLKRPLYVHKTQDPKPLMVSTHCCYYFPGSQCVPPSASTAPHRLAQGPFDVTLVVFPTILAPGLKSCSQIILNILFPSSKLAISPEHSSSCQYTVVPKDHSGGQDRLCYWFGHCC